MTPSKQLSSIIIFAVSMIATIMVFLQESNSQKTHISNFHNKALSKYRNRIESGILQKDAALIAVASIIQNSNLKLQDAVMRKDIQEKISNSLASDIKISSMKFSPTRYFLSQLPPASLTGFDLHAIDLLYKDQRILDLLKNFEEKPSSIFLGPITKESGEVIFRLVRPVLNRQAGLNIDLDQNFWGFVTLEINARLFFESSGIEELSKNFYFFVKTDNISPNDSGILLGDRSNEREYYITDINLPFGRWQLGINHKDLYVPVWDLSWILAIGLILSFGFASTANLAFSKREGEHKKTTQKLLSLARDEAYEANKAKSRFLANMSHEIRTPINTIIGMSNILENTKLSLEQKEYVRTIQLGSEHLQAVIGDILDFSKLEADKLALAEESFSLIQVLEESLAIASPKALEKRIKLFSVFSGEFPSYVAGDATRLKQILLNILSNAIKFTERGKVRMTMRVDYESTDTGDFKSTLLISISDTGAGIPKAKRNEIFKAFSGGVEDLNDSTKRGTGLGLSISKKLIGMMGGQLWLGDSTEGVGSEFWIKLPLTKIKFEKTGEEERAKAHLDFIDSELKEHLTCRLYLMGIETSDLEGADHIFSDNLNRNPEIIKHVKSKFLVHVNSLDVELNDQKASKAISHYEAANFISLKDLREILQSSTGKLKPTSKLEKIKEEKLEEVPDGSNILVVDDNDLNRQVVKKLLEQWNCEVFEADDGLKAVEKAENKVFDLILLDMHMPNLGGIEACKQIKTHYSEIGEDKTTILALTADARIETAEKCKEVGFNEVLLKPIKSLQLKQVLLRYLKISEKSSEQKTLRKSG